MDKSFTWLSVMIPLASILLGAIVSYFSITFFENKKVKWAHKRAKEDFFSELDYLKEHISAQLDNCINGILSFRTVGEPIEVIQIPHFMAFDDTILKRSYADAAKSLNYKTRIAVNGLINKLAELESRNKAGIDYQVSLFSTEDRKVLNKNRKAALTNLRNTARGLAADYYTISQVISKTINFDGKETQYDWIRKYLDEKSYSEDDKEQVISFSTIFKEKKFMVERNKLSGKR